MIKIETMMANGGMRFFSCGSKRPIKAQSVLLVSFDVNGEIEIRLINSLAPNLV